MRCAQFDGASELLNRQSWLLILDIETKHLYNENVGDENGTVSIKW